MYTIKVEDHFDAAHFLFGYEGKCRNLHGHRWIVEASVGAESLQENKQERGMVMDFGVIRAQLKALVDQFDHSMIYEVESLKAETIAALTEEGFLLNPVDFRPTAENFSQYFFERLQREGIPVMEVTVYETPTNMATYQE